MSIHIEAKQGDIAETILLPGDPLRAKWIAETFFENPVCFNKIRNMFGYTGTYNGKKVSVMGTGMGVPSISIYAHELINDYGVSPNIFSAESCIKVNEIYNSRVKKNYKEIISDTNPRRRSSPDDRLPPP